VNDIYEFYVHASTQNDEMYWPYKLLLTVVCGDEDPALPGYPGNQKGRTTITMDQPAPINP